MLAAGAGGGAGVSAQLFFRHVNHGERWRSLAMSQEGDSQRGAIPGDYTHSLLLSAAILLCTAAGRAQSSGHWPEAVNRRPVQPALFRRLETWLSVEAVTLDTPDGSRRRFYHRGTQADLGVMGQIFGNQDYAPEAPAARRGTGSTGRYIIAALHHRRRRQYRHQRLLDSRWKFPNCR